jgi:lipopolysaccharide/colanic/teichoic acid biosynthesis glycosyltransferase
MSLSLVQLARGARRLIRGDREFHRDIASTERFAALLERERARAERLEEEFSLLAFPFERHADELEARAALLEVLRGRLRVTDDLGWLGPGQLGVLLPCTPADGAWKVVSDVFDLYPSHLRPPSCRVYSYPSHWCGEDETSPEAPREQPRRLSDTGQVVYALESLFARPLPLWKRTLDICGAGLGLLLLAPLLGAVALAVHYTSSGPVFFVQQRSGLGGKRFAMYKFRTMVADAEARKTELMALNEQDGPAFKLTRDPRVTPLGRILRKLSIDELPQLWNVLRGDMSLVGPRPLPCRESAGCAPWQRRRLDVTPGLTCIWQVRGRSAVSFDEWARMDLRYIRHRTLPHDLRLIAATVPAVLLGRGGK